MAAVESVSGTRRSLHGIAELVLAGLHTGPVEESD
jgi:hypothetical protein